MERRASVSPGPTWCSPGVLPTAEYALFTLVIALANLGYCACTRGCRWHRESPSPGGRTRAPAPHAYRGHPVGADLRDGGRAGLPDVPLMLLVLFVSTVAGGAMAVSAAQFQSERRYAISLGLSQSPNLVPAGCRRSGDPVARPGRPGFHWSSQGSASCWRRCRAGSCCSASGP